MSKEYFLGVDMGGTNIKIGCFTKELELIHQISAPTHASMGPESVVEETGKVSRELLQQKGLTLDDVCAVGLGVPGPVKLAQGLIVAAPNLPMFRNVPIRKMLSLQLNCPVVMENDANAACWGEHVVGAGTGVRDMIFFTLGTGIGGGVLSNGELVHGFADDAAELGHIILYPGGRVCGCGQKGCVEAYASARSTAKRAREAVEEDPNTTSSLKQVLEEKGDISCKNVFNEAKKGDSLAGEIVEGTAEALGLLCVNILHVTGPQRVVFAGGMIAAGDYLLDRIRGYFQKHIWPMKEEKLEICFATLGEHAGIIGAAGLAVQAHEKGTLASLGQ